MKQQAISLQLYLKRDSSIGVFPATFFKSSSENFAIIMDFLENIKYVVAMKQFENHI